ncbi:MAG: hypothetical protein A3G38_02465, partial [Omnitrophica WOR_2 bacterium RIFCSPLOWO2_12_FULL_51_8]
KWQGQGAELIHLVDLDGAFSGKPKNISVAEEIVKAVDARIEFGGGVRGQETIDKLLDIGVWRVVLGTLAFEDRVLLKNIKQKYKDKIIVSVDINIDGAVALKGWNESAGRQNTLFDFAKVLSSDIGIHKIIYTDTQRDGTLSGPRIALLANYLNLLSKYKISMIAAGGVASLRELKSLAKLEGQGLEGIIIGKALYEEKFSLKEALQLFNHA